MTGKPLRAVPDEPSTPAGTRRLDSYAIRRVEWTDKPFFQRAAFHLIAGRKGTCKGTFRCGLAARVTRGEVYDRPKQVLVITSEDSVELDFLPRFVAAGGNPELVSIVNGRFVLPDSIGWLEETARALGDIGLILIDPMGNHTDGIDTDKEGLVREAIGPLNPLADRLDTMIVGVRHLSKDTSRGALASVSAGGAAALPFLREAFRRPILRLHPQPLTGPVLVAVALRHHPFQAEPHRRLEKRLAVLERVDEADVRTAQLERFEEVAPLPVGKVGDRRAFAGEDVERVEADSDPRPLVQQPHAELMKVRPAGVIRRDDLPIELQVGRKRSELGQQRAHVPAAAADGKEAAAVGADQAAKAV